MTAKAVITITLLLTSLHVGPIDRATVTLSAYLGDRCAWPRMAAGCRKFCSPTHRSFPALNISSLVSKNMLRKT